MTYSYHPVISINGTSEFNLIHRHLGRHFRCYSCPYSGKKLDTPQGLPFKSKLLNKEKNIQQQVKNIIETQGHQHSRIRAQVYEFWHQTSGPFIRPQFIQQQIDVSNNCQVNKRMAAINCIVKPNKMLRQITARICFATADCS